MRGWVEHPFHIAKNLFRHKKLRHRGLAKNTAQLHTLFAVANLVLGFTLTPASGASPGSLVPARLANDECGEFNRTSSPRKATGMSYPSTAIWLGFGIAASLILFLF